MHNYNHKKLIETITRLDALPSEQEEYAKWITAEAHLTFLRENACSDELVIFANGEYSYVDSIVVPSKVLARMSPDCLEQWHFDSYGSIASYVYGGGKMKVWIERGVRNGYDGKQEGTQLVFNRTFEGWEGLGRNYIEVNQEYTHIAGIHWRPEKRAYCRFDGRGDLEATVSVTTREDKGSEITLVTFRWDALEEYLSAADAVLLRRFDFTLLRRDQFSGWPQGAPENFQESNELHYHRLVLPGYAAYTAGRQIIRPRRPRKTIHEGIKDGWRGARDKKCAEFVAYDWRNKRIATISTAPQATTNYFDAKDNSLPFELSPAFFRPEVLSKYKTDRDKYTLTEREVTCRAAWHLRGIDVNEAGQVHAYICDLRRLPYEEQLHWLSYNEQPKASISKRALINDFHGEFVDFSEPPAQLLSIIRRWHDKKVFWWALRDEKLLERVNTPLTSSRDEWAEAFMDLAKLLVEGFETTSIRAKLDDEKLAYSKEDRTIALLEKLLNKNAPRGDAKKFVGLRTVQHLRSKAKGHVTGSEAEELAQQALLEHDTFSNHFKHVCGLVIEDLATIEKLFA
ncbi:hypothetical protein SAMN05216603_102142 [Pseudomonas benzenivorans]|nr:hypothetical protein [Pseudomonas benzenivorans]SDG52030.1 hypothetical protein SAMN05216603_102142 [Pseudomonas benzenivorans]